MKKQGQQMDCNCLATHLRKHLEKVSWNFWPFTGKSSLQAIEVYFTSLCKIGPRSRWVAVCWQHGHYHAEAWSLRVPHANSINLLMITITLWAQVLGLFPHLFCPSVCVGESGENRPFSLNVFPPFSDPQKGPKWAKSKYNYEIMDWHEYN